MENKEVEVQIHDVAFGGSGVARLPDQKIVFVPYTLVGERVRVRITKTKKGFCEGKLIEILEKSPSRIEPPCPYFGSCGGCQYQHATYEEQIRVKTKQLKDTLERIGAFQNLPEIVAHPAPQPYGYRNKITVHRGMKGEIGFYSTDDRTIIDIQKCLIAEDAINSQLERLKKSNPRGERFTITDRLERSSTEAYSFQQVNAAVAQKLLDWVIQQMGDRKDAVLLDLYCGSGFFSIPLAAKFAEVRGVDRDPHAIHSAIVQGNQLKPNNTQFYASAIEDYIDVALDSAAGRQKVILVDPPREGLHPQVTARLVKETSMGMVYVSCNPSTLARDLKILCDKDTGLYKLENLALFDMFPQTSHMETVAVLRPKQ
jgi:tRNA/tmRNA/rRNA uracil-C5-methylase (TrmA/RlmC/RlmD family)